MNHYKFLFHTLKISFSRKKPSIICVLGRFCSTVNKCTDSEAQDTANKICVHVLPNTSQGFQYILLARITTFEHISFIHWMMCWWHFKLEFAFIPWSPKDISKQSNSLDANAWAYSVFCLSIYKCFPYSWTTLQAETGLNKYSWKMKNTLQIWLFINPFLYAIFKEFFFQRCFENEFNHLYSAAEV